MVITIFNGDESADRSILATNLAALLAFKHRRAILIDGAAPKHSLNWNMRRSAAGIKPAIAVHAAESLYTKLESPALYYRKHYPEIIVDTDGLDSTNLNAALVATNVLVVPTWSCRGDLRRQENFIRRIEAVRLFNSALRVLVVDVRTIDYFGDAGKRESEAAAAFANEILGATLSKTVVHESIDSRRAFDDGRSLFECDPRIEPAATEVADLYQEILQSRDLPVKAASGIALARAIERMTCGKAGALSSGCR